MSALRLATNAQGVVQIVGASSPEMVASAPDGVDATLIVSVVPRVTDAQPPNMAHNATQPKIRMKIRSPLQTPAHSSATAAGVQGEAAVGAVFPTVPAATPRLCGCFWCCFSVCRTQHG